MYQIVSNRIPLRNKTTKLIIVNLHKIKIVDLKILDQMFLLKLIPIIIFQGQLSQD